MKRSLFLRTMAAAADITQRADAGIELDPNYVAIARSRIAGDAPLFAQVSE